MIFRKSGGALYHWRALTQAHLWRPFKQDLERWLEQWEIPTKELILIGPSGGHTLPRRWLKNFDKIQAYDVDPLAPTLFRMRHRGLNLQYHMQNMFSLDKELSLAPLRRLRRANPLTPILFCNVLGQLPLEFAITDQSWQNYLQEFSTLLMGTAWSSYHDAFSIQQLPLQLHQQFAQRLRKSQTIEQATANLEHDCTLFDHMTSGEWSKELSKLTWTWSLTSTNMHIIEGVRARHLIC